MSLDAAISTKYSKSPVNPMGLFVFRLFALLSHAKKYHQKFILIDLKTVLIVLSLFLMRCVMNQTANPSLRNGATSYSKPQPQATQALRPKPIRQESLAWRALLFCAQQSHPTSAA